MHLNRKDPSVHCGGAADGSLAGLNPAKKRVHALDTTQSPAPKPTPSRAIHITLLVLGCGHLGWIAGTFAGTVGHLSVYPATGVGAGAFFASVTIALRIMAFVIKGDGD